MMQGAHRESEQLPCRVYAARYSGRGLISLPLTLSQVITGQKDHEGGTCAGQGRSCGWLLLVGWHYRYESLE